MPRSPVTVWVVTSAYCAWRASAGRPLGPAVEPEPAREGETRPFIFSHVSPELMAGEGPIFLKPLGGVKS
ncbi:MAG: hypothetical protein IT208_15300 [Chthonomonadales bacterium]|nr:hypothetical protein [Chthonomonadales bacterium]